MNTNPKSRISILTNDWIFGALLCIAVLVAYYPAMNGSPVWDDDGHITKPELQNGAGFLKIWGSLGAAQQYYPVTHSVFWIGDRLWGMHWCGYHLLNILLHLVSTLLLIKLLRRLGVPGARLAGALFALHPIQVESVAWISELKNCLSGAFFFGAALAWLKFDVKRSPKLYAAALALFLLGMLSKTAIAGLPAALLIVLWWKRGRLAWKRDVLPLVPFFSFGIAQGLFTAWVEGKFVIGREDIGYHYSIIERSLIAGRAFWFYIGKLLLPVNMMFFYPRWDINAHAWQQYLYPAAFLLVAVACFALRRRSRAPLAALGFFLVMLFPALGFIHIFPFRYSFVANHFQYLAGLGLIVPLSAGITALLARYKSRATATEWAIPVLAMALLAVLSAGQSRTFADSKTLYRSIIAANPGCLMAYSNLGLEYQEAGNLDEAEKWYAKAIEQDSTSYGAWCNLGVLLMRKGYTSRAIVAFRKTLRCQPNTVEARLDLGYALMQQGEMTEAIDCFKTVLTANPRSVEGLLNLGDAYFKIDRPDDARHCYVAALELKPQNLTTLNNLYRTFVQLGPLEKAIEAATQARELALATGQATVAQEISEAMEQVREAEERREDRRQETGARR